MKHVFWAIIVSLSMGTAALFLYNNTMDYLHATVSLVRYKRVILRAMMVYICSLNIFNVTYAVSIVSSICMDCNHGVKSFSWHRLVL